MSFQLTIAQGKEAGREFVFDQAEITIGRTVECDIVLYDPGVSRKHARVYFREGDFYVEDLGSSNGTKVNGVVVTRAHPLEDGDAVAVGPVVFDFAALADEEAEGAEVANAQSTRIVSSKSIQRPPG